MSSPCLQKQQTNTNKTSRKGQTFLGGKEEHITLHIPRHRNSVTSTVKDIVCVTHICLGGNVAHYVTSILCWIHNATASNSLNKPSVKPCAEKRPLRHTFVDNNRVWVRSSIHALWAGRDAFCLKRSQHAPHNRSRGWIHAVSQRMYWVVCGELSSKHFNTLKPRSTSQNPCGCNLYCALIVKGEMSLTCWDSL